MCARRSRVRAMERRLCFVVLATVCALITACTAPEPRLPARNATVLFAPPPSIEDQARDAERASRPRNEHPALDPLVGSWTTALVTVAPDGTEANPFAAPRRSSGSWADATSTGSRRSKIGSQAHETTGYLGYDLNQGEYQNLMISDLATGMSVARGRGDIDGTGIRLSLEVVDPASGAIDARRARCGSSTTTTSCSSNSASTRRGTSASCAARTTGATAPPRAADRARTRSCSSLARRDRGSNGRVNPRDQLEMSLRLRMSARIGASTCATRPEQRQKEHAQHDPRALGRLERGRGETLDRRQACEPPSAIRLRRWYCTVSTGSCPAGSRGTLRPRTRSRSRRASGGGRTHPARAKSAEYTSVPHKHRGEERPADVRVDQRPACPCARSHAASKRNVASHISATNTIAVARKRPNSSAARGIGRVKR